MGVHHMHSHYASREGENGAKSRMEGQLVIYGAGVFESAMGSFA